MSLHHVHCLIQSFHNQTTIFLYSFQHGSGYFSDAAAERKSLEDLDMLQKFADAKLDKFKYELDE
jgi:hypothetical protein